MLDVESGVDITLIGMSMVARMFCKKKYDHQMEKSC